MRPLAQAFAFSALLLATVAARADDGRCTGTLCDLYYSNRPAPAPAAPQPAAAPGVPEGATPLTVPSAGGMIGGGGILNFFRGNQSAPAPQPGATAAAGPAQPAAKPFMYITEGKQYERCEGTLCDMYYGSGADKKPAAGTQQASVAPGKGVAPAAPAAPTAEQLALAKVAQQRRATQEAEQQARAKCRVANDPWHCMR